MPLASTRASLGDMETASKVCPTYTTVSLYCGNDFTYVSNSWSGDSDISSVSVASLISSSR
jgi:hypothetical protein